MQIYVNDFEIVPDENLEENLKLRNIKWMSANGFCLNEQNEIAIVFEKAKKSGNNNGWNLPGGGREDGENPEQTFRREVSEEVQAEIETLKYFHCVYEKSVRNICFRFICKLKNISEFELGKNVNGKICEIDERKFINLEELPNYITWLKDSQNGRESFEILKEELKKW